MTGNKEIKKKIKFARMGRRGEINRVISKKKLLFSKSVKKKSDGFGDVVAATAPIRRVNARRTRKMPTSAATNRRQSPPPIQ